jgi:phage terminase large subunit
VAGENAIKIVNAAGDEVVLYEPQTDPKNDQAAFHASDAPNLLALGTRGTGKSWQLRWDAILRCLMFPNFRAILLRRTIPDLRKSHLAFIDYEMKQLGGVYLSTTMEAKFPNGSVLQFSHCEKMTDVMGFLSSEWGWVGFDELSTFPLEMFLQISAAARAREDAPYKAVVRAGSNTLGIGSAWMKQWFIDKTVNYSEYPDYNPADFEVQYSWLEGNKYINQKEYSKRLKTLPDHVRRSWLNLEFIVEGAYFAEFRKKDVDDEGEEHPWHCIQSMPTLVVNGVRQNLLNVPWIKVYRSVDWGYHPDPAVCHWHVVLPSGRKITLHEETWKRTLAKDVALDIKRITSNLSIGRVVATYCDPKMFVKDGSDPFSIADRFEQNGVPLTPSQNDRELFGYAVQEMLATVIEENGVNYPSWQIMEGKPSRCPELIRTLPILQMDPHNPKKLADGPDHWVISCAYFGMGDAAPSRDPVVPTMPRWMIPKRRR